ncbi:MAG: UDP-glucose 4-epimerase GalE [Chlamydiales bacterium]
MSMHVLVAGGAGYIGSHVCKSLKNAGFTPVVIDNLSQGHLWAVRWGPLVRANIDDEKTIKEAISKYKPVGTIHLASSINVRDSLKDPFAYYQNNVMASLRFLEILLKEGINCFVFSSSAAVYGQPSSTPIGEEHSKQPLHPYGRSKLMVEEILHDLHHAHGLVFAALRYFNASGSDPEGEVGEAHDPETHLIPLAITSALGLRPPLQLYGKNFPTSDGTAIRDYIHVSDLAEAHVKTLQLLLSEKKNLILNLGTGEGYSVSQILEQVKKVVGKEVPVTLAPRVPADPTSLVADPSRAKQLLHWTPRYSSLTTIIETAYDWERKRSDE